MVRYETEGDYSTNKIVHRSRGFGVYSNGSSPSRDSVTMVVPFLNFSVTKKENK